VGNIGSHSVHALRNAWRGAVANLSNALDWAVPERRAADKQRHRRRGADRVRLRRARRDRHHAFLAGSVIVNKSLEDTLKYYGNDAAAARNDRECGVRWRQPPHLLDGGDLWRAQRVPNRETDPTMPINPCGRSKLTTERMLRGVSVAHPVNHGCPHNLTVASADQPGRMGQSTAGAMHLIKVACEAALGKRDGVVGAGSG
jgi:UDP-glucose 4-epimerase